MITRKPLVASVVGMDGCGKSSTFHGVLNTLADRIRVVGIGEMHVQPTLVGSYVTRGLAVCFPQS